MADNKNPIGKMAEIGGKQTQGEWFYRFIKMDEEAGGKSGEHWSKTEATIDAHQALFDAKADVEFSWKKGAEGKGDKLQVYAIKSDDKKDSGKRPSAYAKEASAKDDYWKGKDLHDRNKWEWEQARFTRNDKKIELQHYQNLLVPLALERYKTDPDVTIDSVVDWLDSKATELFNRHNPATPAVDVTKK